MANNLKCQTCQVTIIKLLQCSRCSCGYYCSEECQRSDWSDHKKYVCSIWNTASVIPNPWYSTIELFEPRYFEHTDQELLTSIINNDIIALKSFLDQHALINIVRGNNGASLLHIAVISGNINMIQMLLDVGAWINVDDERGATPLYYACSHKGKDKVLMNQTIRASVVQILLDNGADTMSQSGFTGWRPFEAANEYGYHNISDLIINSSFHKKFITIRNDINKPNPPNASLVRKLVDITWRSRTAESMLKSTGIMIQNMKRHPQLKASNASDVEQIFKDCQARHMIWFNQVSILDEA